MCSKLTLLFDRTKFICRMTQKIKYKTQQKDGEFHKIIFSVKVISFTIMAYIIYDPAIKLNYYVLHTF